MVCCVHNTPLDAQVDDVGVDAADEGSSGAKGGGDEVSKRLKRSREFFSFFFLIVLWCCS